MTDKPFVISLPPELKGAWVAASRAQGMKLSDWVAQKVGVMEYDFNGFSLNVPAFEPFERYVRALPDADASALFKRVRALDAQQEDAVAAVKIASMYLEKRCCIAAGTADHALFHDINRDSLSFYAAAPELTHLELIDALAQA